MVLNYTPIDTQKFSQKEDSQLNFYLLLIATLSAFFLAVLLFILIQKKMPKGVIENQTPSPTPTITETAIDTPTPFSFPTIIPTETPIATTSPTIAVLDETTPSAEIGTESAR